MVVRYPREVGAISSDGVLTEFVGSSGVASSQAKRANSQRPSDSAPQ